MAEMGLRMRSSLSLRRNWLIFYGRLFKKVEVSMENQVLAKESPMPTLNEDLSAGRPISLMLESFASSDERIQVHVKDLTAVKFLLAHQSPSSGDIQFITQPTQQEDCLTATDIQLATLQGESQLDANTNQASNIEQTTDKDAVFQPFQIQDKALIDLQDNAPPKSAEETKRLKFISRKLRNIKANINELYKKAGVTAVALSAFDGNVHLLGPDHMSSLEDNCVLKTIFWNAVMSQAAEVSGNGKKNEKNLENKGLLQKWQCDECSHVFSSKHSLFNHKLLSHSNLPVHKCQTCAKEFVDAEILQKHMTIHAEKNFFHCKICGNSFAAQNLLNAHLKIHNGSKPFSCKICSRSFNSSSSLQYHMNKHNGSNKCICKHCNKEFTKMSSLKVHMRIHSGEQPYRCQECGKGFVVSTHLTRHLRVHSGERPYLCEVCGKRFNRSSHLRIHLRIHSGEKPYECEICGKRFNQTVTRKKHLKTHSNCS